MVYKIFVFQLDSKNKRRFFVKGLTLKNRA